MDLFFDTSALAKRYLDEEGRDLVLALSREADSIAVSSLVQPEIISLLSRKRFERKISPAEFNEYERSFLLDFADFNVVSLTPAVFDSCVTLLKKFPNMGTLDSLHLASALEIKPDLFVTFDQRQRVVSKKLGLKTRP